MWHLLDFDWEENSLKNIRKVGTSITWWSPDGPLLRPVEATVYKPPPWGSTLARTCPSVAVCVCTPPAAGGGDQCERWVHLGLKVARQQHSGRFCSYKWKRLKPHNCLEGAQTLLSIGYRESWRFTQKTILWCQQYSLESRRQDGERGSKGLLEEGDEGGVEGAEQGGQVCHLSCFIYRSPRVSLLFRA